MVKIKIDKKKLIIRQKKEIQQIYKSLKQSHIHKKEEEIYKIYNKLDNDKDKHFRLLLFLSMYCTHFHKIKHKINIKNLSSLKHECYKKNNFIILDIDDTHKEIINSIVTYFNTDSTNIEPITGKILYDLYNIDVQCKTNKISI